MMTNVRIANLLVEYRDGSRTIRPIDDFSMNVGAGELVLLMGPSGSGKTTVLSCLAGILSPSGGIIEVDGIDLATLDEAALSAYRRNSVGVVFQAFNLLPSLTATENVAVPLLAAGTTRVSAMTRARELLTDVDLEDRLEHRPGELSGGQQQRVAIARALAFDPPVLLADEPTAHLDHAQAETVLRILRRLTSSGRLVIVSTHDSRLVPLADAVVDLTPVTVPEVAERRRVELAPGEVLFRQGDASDLVWIVRSGEVAIESEISEQATELLATCGEGSYFGELGPLLGFPRSAMARATKKGATVEGYSIRAFRDALGDETPESWGALAETEVT